MGCRTLSFAFNPETCEVYERVPDGPQWKQKLAAWVECRQQRKCSYHHAAKPSPMPHGHIMFRAKKGNFYKPMATPPAPIWTDGFGCIYEGQKVGWTVSLGSNPDRWCGGAALRCEDGQIIVRRWDGGICQIDPYALA